MLQSSFCFSHTYFNGFYISADKKITGRGLISDCISVPLRGHWEDLGVGRRIPLSWTLGR